MALLRALATIVAAVLLVGTAAPPASAHATLLATDPVDGEVLPASPGQVRFTFDEPVSLLPGAIQAFDAEGEPIDTEAAARDEVVTVTVPEELSDGSYVVVWRVVSADGHPVGGSLTFHVGAPSERVVPSITGSGSPPASVALTVAVVQAAWYVALLLAVGLVAFLLWIARGVRLPAQVRRRLDLVLQGAALVTVVLALVRVPLAGVHQLGLGLSAVFDAPAWNRDLVGDQAVILALQGVGFALALPLLHRAGPARGVAAAGALVAVVAPASVGHVRAYEPVWLLMVTDALHLTAGAVWFGGLVALVLALAAVAGRPSTAARLIATFSTSASLLLAVLAVTGVLLAWRILGSWSGLAQTGYGRLLLAKVAIAALVVAIAAWNRWRLVPRVDDLGHEQRRRGVLLVRRAAAGEAALLTVLLLVTGFLVHQSPGPASPVVEPARTGATTAAVGEFTVHAVLDPGPGQQRTLWVQLQDEAGEPVDLAGVPTVALRSVEVDLGRVPVTPVASGTYRVEVVLPITGAWEVQVSVPVDRFTTPVATVSVDVE